MGELARRLVALTDLAGAGRGAVDEPLSLLAGRLLAYPPDIKLEATDLDIGRATVLGVCDPVVRAGVGAVLTLAAWHLGVVATTRQVAADWLADAAAAAAGLDIVEDVEDLCDLAYAVLQVGAICDVLDVDADGGVRTVLRASAAAVSDPVLVLPGLAADLEIVALDLASLGGRWAVAARLAPGPWRRAVAVASRSLHGAVTLGEVSDTRLALQLQVDARTLLGDHQRAQGFRVQFLWRALAEGRLAEVGRALRDLKSAPFRFPDQAALERLLEAHLLLRQGHAVEAGRIGDDVAVRVGPLLAGDPAVIGLWVAAAEALDQPQAVIDLLTPLIQQAAAQQLPPVPPYTDLLARAARHALRLGDPGLSALLTGWLQTSTEPIARLAAQALIAQRAAHDEDLAARSAAHRAALDQAVELERSVSDLLIAEPLIAYQVSIASLYALDRHQMGDDRAALAAAENGRARILARARASRRRTAVSPAARALVAHLTQDKPRETTPLAKVRLSILTDLDRRPQRAFLDSGAVPVAGFDDLVGRAARVLPEGWALASISVTPESVQVGVLHPMTGQVVFAAEPVDVVAVIQRARTLFTRVNAKGPQPPSSSWRAAADRFLADLFPLVGAPLLDGLAAVNCDAATVSAPGWVYSLPLLAIHDGGAPLIDRLRALSTVPSLQVGMDAWDEPVRRGGRVLVGAAPDARAPFIGVEGRAVAAAWRAAGRDVVEDGTLSAPSLLRSLPDRDLVHLAVHGVFDATSSIRSRLVLAGGDLDLADIYGGVSTSADLVVLSACQTAAASFAASDEAIGLTSFFQMSGAARVIGSLWDLDDAVSVLLTTELHRRLIAGEEAVAALNEAQRGVRSLSRHDALERMQDLRQFCADEAEHRALTGLSARIENPSVDPDFHRFDRWSSLVFSGMPGAARL